MKTYTYECNYIETRYLTIRAETEEEAQRHLDIELRRVYEKERIVLDKATLSSVYDGTSSVPSLQKKNGKLSVDLTTQQRTPAPAHIQNILKEADLILEEEDENF